MIYFGVDVNFQDNSYLLIRENDYVRGLYSFKNPHDLGNIVKDYVYNLPFNSMIVGEFSSSSFLFYDVNKKYLKLFGWFNWGLAKDRMRNMLQSNKIKFPNNVYKDCYLNSLCLTQGAIDLENNYRISTF